MPNTHSTLTSLFTDIADAIREKDGTSSPKVADAFPAAIRAIPSGGDSGGAQPQKDVNFIDYDGTILHSYTSAEFAALTALPANPNHSNDIQWGGHTIPLTSLGWNYTLTKAQAYVAKYGKLWIGQMYKPTDGKLHLCVRMGEGRLSPASRFTFTGTATIDWGDGTTPTNAVRDTDNTHTYAAAGDYDVTIGVSAGGTLDIAGGSSSGCYLFQKPKTTTSGYDTVYQTCIHMAFVPDSVTSIGDEAFNGCYGLQSVTIPDGVTSIGDYAFNICYGLQSVTIPDGVTSIGYDAFNECYGLQSVTIPDSVTNIYDEAFYDCYGLQSVTISDSVTSIDYDVFYVCYGLQSVTIPDSVTSIGDEAFNDCRSLQSVTISDSVTSIGDYAFCHCHSLQSVTIPDSVTSIGATAFGHCYGLGFIKFESLTPPTVTNINAWVEVPSDFKIYVPAASLDAYKAATNYPSSSKYTYVGY